MVSTLLRPWRDARLWLDLVLVATTVPFAIVAFSVTIVLLVTSAALVIVLPLAVPVAWLLFVGAHSLAEVERSRLAALADLDLANPVPPLRSDGSFPMRTLRRIGERLRSVPRWKEIGYLLLVFPVALLVGATTLVLWSGSVLLIALPLFVAALPGGSAKFGLVEVEPGLGAVAAALLGIVGLVLAAPWATRGCAVLVRHLARNLLGPDVGQEVAETMSRLETSLVAATDTAEAERRRIERDLHDGAQQRLVALAVQLGAAQERLEHDPEAGRAMVAAAHDEAKAALAELRDLVRGIHPVILEDRGLDAALSAIVARAAIPVDLDVRIDERPPPAVESAAYFIVTEALTNVTRHARATRATVTIVRSGDTLVVEVTDDGIGGADPTRGTGLAGLQQRVAGLRGRMHVLSPDGGPTSLIVELPCRS